ncbi:histone deacetylase HDT1-like protein [Corchorus olitorius]|uniref:Histone deacetylase HDT1-like protein n=1 Tax=Corchorus olitorius TaxID=93759 RepID=A0A1R3HCZ0_9ROSI|nr:histone deacetylase HDT1-like protein [Corchorus olitorius]
MEFWGAEVKSGQNFEVELVPESGRIVHLSQVALGEVTGDNKKEKGNEVCVYIKVKDSKFVIGTLSHEKFPHISLDLVVDDKFELSHNWKNGSVYFTGYYAEINQETCDPDKEPTVNLLKPQATEAGPTTSKQVKIVEPKKDEDSGSSDDEEDSSSDSDDEESSGDEAETSKKRPAESATKTPVPEKKAKLVTPQKTDGKKVGGHTATPHPSKKAGKAEATSGQAKQNQKSGGSSSSSFSCKSCGRSFGSDNALQSHSKAKHGAAV